MVPFSMSVSGLQGAAVGSRRSGGTKEKEVRGEKFLYEAVVKSVVANWNANPHKERIMSTVADKLRQAREAQNLTIHQVADITKIRTDHIRALEEGNFDVFSAQVYIRGFVRTYSTLLKMDVPQVMSKLEAELGGTEKFSEPPPLTDQPKT